MTWILGWIAKLIRRWGPSRRPFHFADQKLLCVRVNVLRSVWEGKNPDTLAHVADAAKALEPAPKDRGGLSVYVVSNDEEARVAALVHCITFNRPEKVVYLLIPSDCLRIENLAARPEPGNHLPPLLSHWHYCLYGLENEEIRRELAAAILRHDPAHIIGRIAASDVKKEAAMYLNDPSVKPYVVHLEKWMKHSQ